MSDSCFALSTSVNYGDGKYQLAPENHIIISDYMSTTVGNLNAYQSYFDEQLLCLFFGKMSYSYTGNKLIFRRDKNKEIVFTPYYHAN